MQSDATRLLHGLRIAILGNVRTTSALRALPNPLYKAVLDRLEQRLRSPEGDDDEATVHVAIAQLYEELKMSAEAAAWYHRAAEHCAARNQRPLAARHRKAAELLTPAPPASRESEYTPRLPPPKPKK